MARNDFGEDSPRATYSHSHGIVRDGRRPSRHAPALSLNATLPQTVQATVHQGHIVLTGRVAWLYQRGPDRRGRQCDQPHRGRD